jgi:hypothetical protein
MRRDIVSDIAAQTQRRTRTSRADNALLGTHLLGRDRLRAQQHMTQGPPRPTHP